MLLFSGNQTATMGTQPPYQRQGAVTGWKNTLVYRPPTHTSGLNNAQY